MFDVSRIYNCSMWMLYVGRISKLFSFQQDAAFTSFFKTIYCHLWFIYFLLAGSRNILNQHFCNSTIKKSGILAGSYYVAFSWQNHIAMFLQLAGSVVSLAGSSGWEVGGATCWPAHIYGYSVLIPSWQVLCRLYIYQPPHPAKYGN